MIRLTTILTLTCTFAFAACGGEEQTPSRDRTLAVVSFASIDPSAPVDASCLVVANNTLETAATTVDVDGQAVNRDCVLMPVYLQAESKTYWMAGQDITVQADGVPDDTGETANGKVKSIKHALSTVEDLVQPGSFTLKVYPRDDETTVRWSGEVTVLSYDLTNGVQLKVSP